MRERGILFGGPMVRAILADAKTQTRRVVSRQPEQLGKCVSGEPAWYWTSRHYDNGDGVKFLHTGEGAAKRLMAGASPYGVVGDRLWVREAFAPYVRSSVPAATIAEAAYVLFRDGGQKHKDGHLSAGLARYAPGAWEGIKFRPSIHMPRWASRITLEVTDVRVQRVQEITEDDAIAEGVRQDATPANHREHFRALWDSLNAERGYSWESNCWCWAITFRRLP